MKIEVKKGDVFGMLKVVSESPTLRLPSGQTNRVFLCECECGNTKEVRLVHLKNNRTKSCGCINKVVNLARKYTQQEKYILRIYKSIKERTQENQSVQNCYSENKIRMCDLWFFNPYLFLEWGLKNNLRKGMHIDRINGLKGYCPENCRVVSPKENVNNRKNTFFINYKGKKYAFTELVELKKLTENESAIRTRLKRGWNTENAFDEPIRKGNYKRKTTHRLS
jgi:hypothetical protein